MIAGKGDPDMHNLYDAEISGMPVSKIQGKGRHDSRAPGLGRGGLQGTRCSHKWDSKFASGLIECEREAPLVVPSTE